MQPRNYTIANREPAILGTSIESESRAARMPPLDPHQAEAVGEIANELTELARTASASNADAFQLRQILGVVGQVIVVVGESFETVYGLLIELRYLSESDVQAGRHLALRKELDLLLARSHFHNS